jgi:hypothetical protein
LALLQKPAQPTNDDGPPIFVGAWGALENQSVKRRLINLCWKLRFQSSSDPRNLSINLKIDFL